MLIHPQEQKKDPQRSPFIFRRVGMSFLVQTEIKKEDRAAANKESQSPVINGKQTFFVNPFSYGRRHLLLLQKRDPLQKGIKHIKTKATMPQCPMFASPVPESERAKRKIGQTKHRVYSEEKENCRPNLKS
jgi:hypothetical protein